MNLEKQEMFSQIWDGLNEDSIDYLDKEFKNIAPKLIGFLIVSILAEDEIDIGTYMEGSIISYDIYNTDKELTLKLSSKCLFELELSIRDSEGDLKRYLYALNENDLKIIPIGLKNIMAEVANSQEEKTLFIKSILP